jgi:hypothetical protein
VSHWQPIETAPLDAAFIAIDRHWDVSRCWRYQPSPDAYEILTFKNNKGFLATHWMPVNPPRRALGGGNDA